MRVALLARARARFPRKIACKLAPPLARAMSSSGALTPPPPIRIDRDAFTTSIRVRAIRVPIRETDAVLRALRGVALDIPKVKAVASDGEGKNLILLNDKVRASDDLASVIPADRFDDVLRRVGGSIETTEYEVALKYEYFNASQVLRKLLPDAVEVPSSFETVGHVAHMNLREEYEAHKYLIGAVILEKNERLKTVVNKVGSIESEFRVPEWELLAGDPSLVTEVKQHGATFKLDFGSVYWNSRLETEHKRLVDSFKPDDVICDATSGVGPFSVPAAQRGIRCYASDLNPDCAKYLKMNVQENRVKNMVKCYNMDARAFIRALLAPPENSDVDREKEWLKAKADYETKLSNFNAKKKEAKEKKQPFRESKPALIWAAADDDGEPPAGATFDHIITNLPASGIEFLDCLKGSFDKNVWEGRDLPMVHCYTFKGADETNDDVIKRGGTHLGADIVNGEVRDVRDVSPNKLMVLLSFRVTPEVAFANDAKRQCRE